jgi:hypothetical protein
MTRTNDDHDEHERLRLVVEGTDGRENLEALSDTYARRLHRQSDDFDATHGLRLVSAKLRRTSYGPAIVTTNS